MFKVGDMAVYRGYGVGVLESIEKRRIGDHEQTFYVLKILNNNMVISIPTANSANLGLRALITANEVERVYEILRERDVVRRSWRVRYKECIDKINSGSVYAIAAALRDLHLAKSGKAWSISEKKMMGTAQNHLVQELAIVDQTDEFLVKQQIEQIFI